MTGESLAAGRVVPEVLQRWSTRIEQEMRRQALPTTTHLGNMAAYHLGWVDADRRPAGGGGGKRMRPSLCLWATAACGGEPEAALAVATAIELLHNFTLVHDDIQDGDVLRRGRP